MSVATACAALSEPRAQPRRRALSPLDVASSDVKEATGDGSLTRTRSSDWGAPSRQLSNNQRDVEWRLARLGGAGALGTCGAPSANPAHSPITRRHRHFPPSLAKPPPVPTNPCSEVHSNPLAISAMENPFPISRTSTLGARPQGSAGGGTSVGPEITPAL